MPPVHDPTAAADGAGPAGAEPVLHEHRGPAAYVTPSGPRRRTPPNAAPRKAGV
ncbi:hypothetical protein AB0N06_27910 [Streptomyces sp. NPDC051020]|uniref:hypothetical protein n=1 Tax=Streptomyces sp. NPDC051020 TaxID=3155409 RepID=UPI0034138F92